MSPQPPSPKYKAVIFDKDGTLITLDAWMVWAESLASKYVYVNIFFLYDLLQQFQIKSMGQLKWQCFTP